MKLLISFALLQLFLVSWGTKLPYSWKKKELYYYSDLNVKLNEVLNDNCRKSVVLKKENVIELPRDRKHVAVSSFPVSNELSQWWLSFPHPKQMRVDPNLCDGVYLKKLPIFNNSGCQLPDYMSPSAPRCQTGYLKWICDQSRMEIETDVPNHFVLPEARHSKTEMPPQPWLISARDSYVTLCGQVIGSCGLVHTTANCKARGYKSQGTAFQRKCSLQVAEQALKLGSSNMTCPSGTPHSSEVEVADKVFVVAEVDDSYIYHIHLEIMPRLIYHLDFLLANPDVKILIGCDSRKDVKATMQGLRQGLMAMRPLMDLAGLSMDRLVVHKHLFAKEIYLPMEGGCQDPVYNTWQILKMRQFYLEAAGERDRWSMQGHRPDDPASQKPLMILMKRSSNAKHTRNGHDLVRQWSDKFTDAIWAALSVQFPQFDVQVFSDKNISMMTCHSCQVQLFARSSVLIGVHGAGLANMLYMKPNSAVVELGPYGNDGRCLLGGGPFSRIAAVMSHNYMIHHPKYEEFKWIVEERCSEFNITRFVVHINSFLKSIEFV